MSKPGIDEFINIEDYVEDVLRHLTDGKRMGEIHDILNLPNHIFHEIADTAIRTLNGKVNEGRVEKLQALTPIKTGYSALNNVFNGGFRLGESCLIIGDGEELANKLMYSFTIQFAKYNHDKENELVMTSVCSKEKYEHKYALMNKLLADRNVITSDKCKNFFGDDHSGKWSLEPILGANRGLTAIIPEIGTNILFISGTELKKDDRIDVRKLVDWCKKRDILLMISGDETLVEHSTYFDKVLNVNDVKGSLDLCYFYGMTMRVLKNRYFQLTPTIELINKYRSESESDNSFFIKDDVNADCITTTTIC